MEKKLIYTELCAPTKESAFKLIYVQCENSLNIPSDELKGRTFYEEVLISGKADGVLKLIPEIKKSPVYNEYIKMLPMKKQEFVYTSVYSKTGGILNAFHPTMKESMDLDMKLFKKQCSDFPQAIDLWKDKKSELWSNLPPKLVWTGGGKLETELLKDFLKLINRSLPGSGFESQGDSIKFAYKMLRGWQFERNPLCNNERPFDAVLNERQEIYERKSKLIKELGIKCDFV